MDRGSWRDVRLRGPVVDARYATDARADEESETLFLSTARFRAFVREQPQHSLALINQLMAERPRCSTSCAS